MPLIQAFATAEGVVRKLRMSLPTCDVAIVYVTTDFLTPGYHLDSGIDIIQIYERLADHYAIPSINMELEIEKKAIGGNVMWRGKLEDFLLASGGKHFFAYDGVHPYKETGCAVYTQAIGRSLPELEQFIDGIKRALPPPLDPNNFEGARFVPPDRVVLASSVRKIALAADKGKPYANETRFLAQRPGDTFNLSFMGRPWAF